MDDKQKLKKYHGGWYKKNKQRCNKESRLWRLTHEKYCQRYAKEYRFRNRAYHWAYNTLYCHSRSGYHVRITLKELIKYFNEHSVCELCGTRLNKYGGKLSNYSPTLDRKDNEKIITVDNVMILCYLCNVTKRDRSFKDFIDYCKFISNRFK